MKMTKGDPMDRLDRHALVMALWSPVALVAATLLHLGISGGGAWWIAAGFVAILVGFVGHIIANAALGTEFTSGEVALGGVVYAAAVVALLTGALLAPSDRIETVLLPIGLGLAALLVAVISYLLIAYGPRRAFEKFDVIRDNNLRRASRLPHRGGRQ